MKATIEMLNNKFEGEQEAIKAQLGNVKDQLGGVKDQLGDVKDQLGDVKDLLKQMVEKKWDRK